MTNLAEYNLIHHSSNKRHILLESISQVENTLDDRRTLVDLLDHSLPDQLVNRRNSHNDGRLVSDQVSVTVSDGILGEGFRSSVGDGNSGKVESHLDQQLEDVSEGQEGEEDIIRAELGQEQGLGSGD